MSHRIKLSLEFYPKKYILETMLEFKKEYEVSLVEEDSFVIIEFQDNSILPSEFANHVLAKVRENE